MGRRGRAARLRALPAALRPLLAPAALLLALALAGGVAASDALQYHGSNLAPTARYEELASIDSRFAGRGPALFTDYDEYSLYLLRDLDVGGPGFMYPPPAIVQTEGQPANLDLIPPAALRSYPLIVTRRDPAASRPPAAYRLLYQGAYYEVWGRRPGAPAALAHVGGRECELGRLLAHRRRSPASSPRRTALSSSARARREIVGIDVARALAPRVGRVTRSGC